MSDLEKTVDPHPPKPDGLGPSLSLSGRGAVGFTGSPLDRADHLRLKPEQVAELAASPDARLLRLAEFDPVLDEAGRLAWDCMEGWRRMPS
jgi:hypothetical protein